MELNDDNQQSTVFEICDEQDAKKMLQACYLLNGQRLPLYLTFCKETAIMTGTTMRNVAAAMVREAFNNQGKLNGLID